MVAISVDTSELRSLGDAVSADLAKAATLRLIGGQSFRSSPSSTLQRIFTAPG